MDAFISTSIEDRNGDRHEYAGALLPGLRGYKLGNELLGLLGESVDLSGGVSTALQGISRGLLARPKLVLDLLSGVTRDGQLVDNEGGFSAAYTGNYGELLRALEWLVEENFASFFPAAAEVIGVRLAESLKSLDGASGTSWLAMMLASGPSGELSKPGSEAESKSPSNGASAPSSKRSNTSTRKKTSKR